MVTQFQREVNINTKQCYLVYNVFRLKRWKIGQSTTRIWQMYLNTCQQWWLPLVHQGKSNHIRYIRLNTVRCFVFFQNILNARQMYTKRMQKFLSLRNITICCSVCEKHCWSNTWSRSPKLHSLAINYVTLSMWVSFSNLILMKYLGVIVFQIEKQRQTQNTIQFMIKYLRFSNARYRF